MAVIPFVYDKSSSRLPYQLNSYIRNIKLSDEKACRKYLNDNLGNDSFRTGIINDDYRIMMEIPEDNVDMLMREITKVKNCSCKESATVEDPFVGHFCGNKILIVYQQGPPHEYTTISRTNGSFIASELHIMRHPYSPVPEIRTGLGLL